MTRFPTKEKLASYAGLVPRQDQSGNRDIRGHITKKRSSASADVPRDTSEGFYNIITRSVGEAERELCPGTLKVII